MIRGDILEKKVAGTVILFAENCPPRFLVDCSEEKEHFMTVDIDETKTNLGTILDALMDESIDVDALELIDLVMLGQENYNIPLYVFGCVLPQLPTLSNNRLRWSSGQHVQDLLKNIELSDTPFFNM